MNDSKIEKTLELGKWAGAVLKDYREKLLIKREKNLKFIREIKYGSKK